MPCIYNITETATRNNGSELNSFNAENLEIDREIPITTSAVTPDETTGEDNRYENAPETHLISQERWEIMQQQALNSLVVLRKRFLKYDETISLYKNREKSKLILEEVKTLLAPFAGNLHESMIKEIKMMNTNNIIPPNNSININEFLKVKHTKSRISGGKYMSIYKAGTYLLSQHADISAIKNFFNVIDKNKPADILNNFKEKKDSLTNIIIGLIKIAFSYKKIILKYENTYTLVYKNQIFSNVIFDFDEHQIRNNFVFLKKVPVADGYKILKFEISKDEFTNVNLTVERENARSIDNMLAEEVPAPIEIEVFESKDFEKEENLEFSMERLEKIIPNDDFKEKVYSFINGAFLIYPEIMDSLPSNITLKKEEFKIFEYLEFKNKEISEKEISEKEISEKEISEK